MTHFKIDFGIVHDVDPPYKSNGHRNGMWTENGKIREAVLKAREAGLTVRHRVSGSCDSVDEGHAISGHLEQLGETFPSV